MPVKKQEITRTCETITMAYILRIYFLIKSPRDGLWRG